MSPRVRTAIFPVAGRGTRFLPATKAIPKELLPVIDTPLIQFAINEAVEAGVERLVFVSHPSKGAIERHVMDDDALRAALTARGKTAVADRLRREALEPDQHDVVFTTQSDPLGLGHAVLCAAPHVLPGPVAVLLPDDLILAPTGALAQMIAAHEHAGCGHLVATMQVPPEEVRKYGVLCPIERTGRIVTARTMVEKPQPLLAPSRLAVVGRYILDPRIFDDLEAQPPGADGEVQLTDAIARSAADVGLAGVLFDGTRFDCGSKAGMLAATLHLAADDPDYADVLSSFARRMTGKAAA
jgi:UTP--glucose-1-phosphate uridylyltransferase